MSFDNDLKRFIKKTGVEVDVAVRKVALDVYSEVTKKTPVDTGRARANWNLATGMPDVSTSNRTNKQRPSLKKGDGEKVIYITNNLPYIHALEHGHSKQAPNGMVALTMSEIRASLR